MAGMPSVTETSTDIGGAAQFFRQVEGWLNVANLQTRKSNRAGARGRVDNNFAGVGTTTLAPVGGFGHFNRHWRKMQSAVGNPPPGDRPWWPNITAARVNEQMGAAFFAALAPANDPLDIRLWWDCSELNLNAGDSKFTARAIARDGAIYVEIRSPRAPGNVPDPATGLANYGFNPESNLTPGSLGPFTRLGDLDVANYDGTAGFDSSFDNDRGAITENNGFRESWSFFPINDRVENASQNVVGLSYTRDSWRRVGADDNFTFEEKPLHSETGYVLWDEDHGQAYRAIAMPRGVTVLAVARGVTGDSTELHFDTEPTEDDPLGGGILANPVLNQTTRTARFTSTLTIREGGTSFTYDDVAEQQRTDSEEIFRHTDSNTLVRV